MEKESYRILVVDDDLRLRDLLKRYLGEQGFNVKTVSDAPQMDRALLREHFDLMVLDLMLPGEDGLSICRRLRGTSNAIPIVMLTAKGDDVDRIVGLEMGADDYLPKPFNPRELVARIHAVLRRQPQTPPGAPATDDEDVRFGQIVVQFVFAKPTDEATQDVRDAIAEAQRVLEWERGGCLVAAGGPATAAACK